MRKWLRIIEDCKMLESKESEVHPHCPEEKAHLLHSIPTAGRGSEFEMMNFLYSLVLLWKPERILETGTQYGLTSIALAAACEFNGFGKVTTIDVERHEYAGKTSRFYGLDKYIDFVIADSVEWTASYEGEPFDFILFDTLLNQRWTEYQNLNDRGKINGVYCFHDSSRLRGESYHDFCPEFIASMDSNTNSIRGLESKLGRGLRIFQT